MKRIGRLIFVILVLGGVIFTPFNSMSAHQVSTGNARVEVLAFESGLRLANGYIEYATPQLRSGSAAWSWMAISISQPPSGQDCHTGTTSASSLRVVRVGWMKYAPWGTLTYAMAAWIDTSSNLNLRQGPSITKKNFYQIDSPSNGWWRYWVNNVKIVDILYGGVSQNDTRCMTAGGWARTFQDGIGVAGIEDVKFANTNSSTIYSQSWAFPERHRDRNSPYSFYEYSTGNFQFSGNN